VGFVESGPGKPAQARSYLGYPAGRDFGKSNEKFAWVSNLPLAYQYLWYPRIQKSKKLVSVIFWLHLGWMTLNSIELRDPIADEKSNLVVRNSVSLVLYTANSPIVF